MKRIKSEEVDDYKNSSEKSGRPDAPPHGEECGATRPRATKQATKAAYSIVSLFEGFFFTVIEEASSGEQGKERENQLA
jgi:hypothetical protein